MTLFTRSKDEPVILAEALIRELTGTSESQAFSPQRLHELFNQATGRQYIRRRIMEKLLPELERRQVYAEITEHKVYAGDRASAYGLICTPCGNTNPVTPEPAQPLPPISAYQHIEIYQALRQTFKNCTNTGFMIRVAETAYPCVFEDLRALWTVLPQLLLAHYKSCGATYYDLVVTTRFGGNEIRRKTDQSYLRTLFHLLNGPEASVERHIEFEVVATFGDGTEKTVGSAVINAVDCYCHCTDEESLTEEY